jgi:hypothetical protein
MATSVIREKFATLQRLCDEMAELPSENWLALARSIGEETDQLITELQHHPADHLWKERALEQHFPSCDALSKLGELARLSSSIRERAMPIAHPNVPRGATPQDYPDALLFQIVKIVRP